MVSGIKLDTKMLQPGQSYLVYGKVSFFQNTPQIVHPEIEIWTPGKQEGKSFLEPVYSYYRKIKVKRIRRQANWQTDPDLNKSLHERDIPENLPGQYYSSTKIDEPF